jgi:hypothetical protein
MIVRPIVTACALALFVALLDAQSQAPKHSAIAAIDSYAKSVDSFIKLNPNALRIFANVASGTDKGPDRWRRFRSEAERQEAESGHNLNETAFVWLKAGKVVGANFTFQSGSRDWAHFVMYYFREDGTLAKIRAQLNTFYGNISVMREQVYSSSGKLLRKTTRYLDLESQEPRRPTADFQDEPIPVYRRVRDLPFYKLL